MATESISFRSPRPKDSTGNPVNEGSEIPIMRPRTGPRGSDAALAKLLGDALEYLSRSDCTFWGCEGATRPRPMCTCVKCWAMREVATVKASLEARLPSGGGE